MAYQEKEEQIVENELLKDDYEKLLSQYEREKQARKDTELVSSHRDFQTKFTWFKKKYMNLETLPRRGLIRRAETRLWRESGQSGVDRPHDRPQVKKHKRSR